MRGVGGGRRSGMLLSMRHSERYEVVALLPDAATARGGRRGGAHSLIYRVRHVMRVVQERIRVEDVWCIERAKVARMLIGMTQGNAVICAKPDASRDEGPRFNHISGRCPQAVCPLFLTNIFPRNLHLFSIFRRLFHRSAFLGVSR